MNCGTSFYTDKKRTVSKTKPHASQHRNQWLLLVDDINKWLDIFESLVFD